MHADHTGIKTLINQTMHETASRYGCSLQDLRLVGRPELMYALILAGEMPSRPIEMPSSRSVEMPSSSMLYTFVVTSIIEERDMGGGRQSSDLLVIHRDDVRLVVDMEAL